MRLISHRDLMRLVERLLRRVNAPLAMSQGFHPKAIIRFASALGLGIEGANEWVEIHVTQEINATAFEVELRANSPPGFVVREVMNVPPTELKLAANSSTYEVPVPDTLRQTVAESVARWKSADSWPIQREGRKTPVDLIGGVRELEFVEDTFRMTLWMNVDGSVRPREAAAAVGLGDLTEHGIHLTRTSLEIATR